jgi:hypothetical protein
MKKHDDITPVQVFAGTAWQAGVVKSMLEAEGIEAFLKDEFSGTIVPWWVAPGGANAVKVLVTSTDEERARPVIMAYEETLHEES